MISSLSICGTELSIFCTFNSIFTSLPCAAARCSASVSTDVVRSFAFVERTVCGAPCTILTVFLVVLPVVWDESRVLSAGSDVVWALLSS